MKIDLTSEEYRQLLDMLSISAFVLEAGREEPLAITRPYLELEQKLFSYAAVFDCQHLVSFFPEAGEAVPTEEFEATSPYRDLVEDYNDFVFWEEIVARLADRDLVRDFGVDAVEDMSLEERIARDKEYEKGYWDEFEKHGIERVEVLPVD